MSAQPQPINGQQPSVDLIDRIANALPEELRVDYYRELAHCRNLPENDEMLRILRAMQFLTVLIERAPGQVAIESERIAEVVTNGIETIQAMHQATVAHQKQLEARIAKLPEEIAKGINAETIAAKLSESLRQQFHQTGLPAVAEAIGVQATTLRHASKDLSDAVDDFAHPRTGVLSRVNEAIRWGKADLQNATDHIRVQMNGLGKELYRTIAVVCGGALLVGLVGGALYERWLDSPLPHTAAPSSALKVQPAPPAGTTPQPNKKRLQSNVPGQQ
jgi:hypothetical protein